MPCGARILAGVTLLTVDNDSQESETPGQIEAAHAFQQCQKFNVSATTTAELREPGSSQ
jgi:hypothetical protein